MPDVDINYDNLLAFAHKVGGTAVVLDAEMRKRIDKSLDVFQQAVQLETPVNMGALRGSVLPSVTGTALDWTGILTTALSYGLPVEFGREPGRMPPPQALELWVVRKWGLQGEQAVQASWALARHIAKHDTKGAFMFQKGFDNALPAVMRLWDDLPGAVVEQV